MERTSRRVWPVIVAISASVHPASASRVTAVPRRSLNVTPNIPARLHAFRHEVRKPSGVQGFPSVVVRIMVLRFTAASRVLLSGAPTGMTTRTLPFDCLSLMCVPSYAHHGSRKRSPWRCPVQSASVRCRCRCAGADFRNSASSSPVQIFSAREPR
jgi:hypothetical protein